MHAALARAHCEKRRTTYVHTHVRTYLCIQHCVSALRCRDKNVELRDGMGLRLAFLSFFKGLNNVDLLLGTEQPLMLHSIPLFHAFLMLLL